MRRTFSSGALATLAAVLLTACGQTPLPKQPTQPQPQLVRPIAFHTCEPTAQVWLDGAGVPAALATPVQANASGFVGFPVFPGDVTAFNVHATAANHDTYGVVVTGIRPGGSGIDFFLGDCEQASRASYALFYPLAAWPSVVPPLPTPPTRDQALNVCLTFQGLSFYSNQFNEEMPLFEAAMPWLGGDDRDTIYRRKRAAANPFCPAGDTHSIIAVPDGRPLYDEPNQPYNAGRFPSLDWTAGETHVDGRLADLVVEQRRAGFIPLVFLDERFDHSNAMLPLVIDALRHNTYGVDLTAHVVILPGWDGVFYGWEPSHQVIPAWAARARQLCPSCMLGIEHNTGHIPLGEGDSDWVSGGLMKDFDLLMSEFDDARFDDSVWQIAARTIGPAYRRPADQPSSDDPRPPFYLREPTARGPRRACAFEFYEYGWVHDWYRADHAQLLKDVQEARKYFKNIGYSCGG
jgi:hypothetical protein